MEDVWGSGATQKNNQIDFFLAVWGKFKLTIDTKKTKPDIWGPRSESHELHWVSGQHGGHGDNMEKSCDLFSGVDSSRAPWTSWRRSCGPGGLGGLDLLGRVCSQTSRVCGPGPWIWIWTWSESGGVLICVLAGRYRCPGHHGRKDHDLSILLAPLVWYWHNVVQIRALWCHKGNCW